MSTPVRTCVGCRRRDPATELDRLTARIDGNVAVLVADHARRLGGRGAWLHRSQTCIEQAVKRNVMRRALRIPQAVRAEWTPHGSQGNETESGM